MNLKQLYRCVKKNGKLARTRKLLLILPSSIFFFILLPLITAFFGGKLDKILHLPAISFGFLQFLSVLFLLVVGGYYVFESIKILLKEGGGIPLGDVIPSDQSIQLLTKGVYKNTRNPMLFGYILVLCALGILAKSFSFALILPGFYLILWVFWLKLREEPFLVTRFGEKYVRYKQETPFLIPYRVLFKTR
jgi:protein-S-isoprenylcysteine O-methyltransferase Ste14